MVHDSRARNCVAYTPGRVPKLWVSVVTPLGWCPLAYEMIQILDIEQKGKLHRVDVPSMV